MPGSTARSPPGRSGGDRGLRVIVGRIREARDETIDLLFALTSFQTFDVLAGPTRTPADVAPIVLRAARAILDLPI